MKIKIKSMVNILPQYLIYTYSRNTEFQIEKSTLINTQFSDLGHFDRTYYMFHEPLSMKTDYYLVVNKNN